MNMAGRGAGTTMGREEIAELRQGADMNDEWVI